MQLTQEQLAQLKAKGLSDSDISSMAQAKGYTLPAAASVVNALPVKPSTQTSTPLTSGIVTPKEITQDQIIQLKNKGLSDSDIQSMATAQGYSLPKPVGGFQGFVQGIAKPFLKVASSLISVPAALDKNPQNYNDFQNKGVDYGYLGKVKPVGAGFDINKPITDNIRPAADAVGTGAEIASWLVGGPEAKSVVNSGLKGLIFQGAKEGAKLGAATAGAMSFGQSLQEADSQPADVAYKTLFGTLTGGLTGGALGAITPIVIKGISGGTNFLRRFTNVSEVNSELNKLNQQVFAPTRTQLKNFGSHDTIQTYTDIFGTKLPQVDKNNRFLKESVQEFANKVDEIYKPAAEGFNTILRNSPETISINEVKNTSLKNIKEASLTPKARLSAIAKVEDEFSALTSEARLRGYLLGEDKIPVSHADNFKDIFWSATRNFGSEESTIANTVNRSSGFAFKDAIENAVKDVNVQNYNKKLGDLITLRDFVESTAGKQAGTGGKLTRLIAGRLAGTVAGAAGGVPGAIAGNITGNLLARMMINPELQPYRWIINKRLSQLPKAEILRLEEEANQVLQNMFKKRIETLALPAPVTEKIAGVVTPVVKSQTNPIILGGKTEFEAPAQSSFMTRTNKTGDAYQRDLKTGKVKIIPKK